MYGLNVLERNDGDALENHQGKNEQGGDQGVAKDSPGKAQVGRITREQCDNHAADHRHDGQPSKQTKQPHGQRARSQTTSGCANQRVTPTGACA